MIKVLIVDDEKLLRKEMLLEIDWTALNCIVVGEASNGIEAIEAVDKYKPDLIISDIKMPKMDGLQMLEKLRTEKNDIEIIFVTAYDNFFYAQKSIKLLAADYLLKPLKHEELEDAILRIKETLVNKRKKNNVKNQFYIKLMPGRKSRYTIEAIKYILNNYDNCNLSVSLIARELDISGGHISRLFKKETGYTILSYITQVRIGNAKILLSDYRYKIYEVGKLVGYRDITYFSSIFKRMEGESPSEYQSTIGLAQFKYQEI